MGEAAVMVRNAVGETWGRFLVVWSSGKGDREGWNRRCTMGRLGMVGEALKFCKNRADALLIADGDERNQTEECETVCSERGGCWGGGSKRIEARGSPGSR